MSKKTSEKTSQNLNAKVYSVLIYVLSIISSYNIYGLRNLRTKFRSIPVQKNAINSQGGKTRTAEQGGTHHQRKDHEIYLEKEREKTC